MHVQLDYGRSGLNVQVPDWNLEAVLSMKPTKPHYWAERGVREALMRSIGCPPLAAKARGKKSACVVICDITRPVPNRAILSQMLPVIEMGGIQREEITLLVATGTHRPSTPEELVAMLGPDIARDYRVVNHVATDRDTHEYLGETPRGVPMWVDRRFLEAELKVSVGLIEPHFMAGYSGGRKLICPGICGMDTVEIWHGPKFIGHPLSDSGVVQGNPVHEDALYVAKQAGLEFICDVTLDEDRRVVGIFAGDPEAAWERGVQAVEGVVRAELREPADIVITSAAGYPLDLTFYQAVKGMVGALPAVKSGGTVIIASQCQEGIGSPHFTDTLLQTDDLNAFVEKTFDPGFFVPDQWEVHELHKAVSKAEVLMYTEGIPADTLSRCFVTPIRSVEDGIQSALQKHGQNARIAVIPKGPYVIPTVTHRG
jgi:lactate racemase